MQMVEKYNNKGITLVSLVVTIVILLIIASISINWGLNSVQESKDNILLSELNMVQHAVLEQYTKYKIESKVQKELELPGKIINNIQENNIILEDNTENVTVKISKEISKEINNNDSYSQKSKEEKYYFLDKESLKDLELEKGNNCNYIVNYKTGTVINVTIDKTSDGKDLSILNINSQLK